MRSVPKVLVVEDEHDIAVLIKHALERSGDATVEIVSSGDTALTAAADLLPDLIILDIILPGIHGIEILQILKGDPELERIPVLMLTSLSEADRIKECLDSGAKGYIIKDKRVSAEEIAEKVNLLLNLPD